MGVMANWRLARATADLGRIRAGYPEEAERLARKATGVFAGLLGEGDPLTLRGRRALATALFGLQRWEEAEQEARLGLAAVPAASRSTPAAKLHVLLAHVLRVTGRLAEAEVEARAALSPRTAGPGVHRISAKDVLALVLGDLGRHGDAVELLTGIIAEHAGEPGPGGLLALKARTDRMAHLTYLGRYDEAAAEAATARAAAATAPEPLRRLTPLAVDNTLAVGLSLQGHHQEAAQLLRSALANAGQDRFALLLHVNAARAAIGTGEPAEARRAVAAAEAVAERMHATSAHDTSALAFARASVHLASERPADAEGEARRCLDLCTRHLAPVHHRALEAETLLGAALARQGKHDEAAEQLRAALDAWLANFGEQHHGTAAARRALAEAAGPV